MEQKSIDRVALIDFDPIFYIVGHVHRETDPLNVHDVNGVKNAVDSILDMTMTVTGSNRYICAVSDEKNYRHTMYKYDSYKGNRGPKPEFIDKWKDIITAHIKDKWNMVLWENQEADDVIAYSARHMYEGVEYVVCSPDKDLKQIPGMHFDYSREGVVYDMTEKEANDLYHIQLLTGDMTDNVHGIPGLGPVKAKALLTGHNPIEYNHIVRQAYIKYYGPHYGKIIYEETRMAISLGTFCSHTVIRIHDYVPTHLRAFDLIG